MTCLALSVAATEATAQVPNANRHVHPSIAVPASGVLLWPSPHLAVPDGKWNHGEGFLDASSPQDRGAWFDDLDDGTGMTSADVHAWPPPPAAPAGWVAYTWTDHIPSPQPQVQMRRFVGYMRPANADALPTSHPIYGSLAGTPFPQYVDQGAFEAFCPPSGPSPSQRIVIVLLVHSTFAFPKDFAGKSRSWNQTYCGLFSPDGLARDEKWQANRLITSDFTSNLDPDAVLRPSLELLGSWNSSMTYWPILVQATLSVPSRSTTLNEQRQLQAVQAVKLLLQSGSGVMNPLGAGMAMSAQDVEDEVVVCLVGGSNGGHQGYWATLRHPRISHGCYAEVINPSIQRLYGEHDLGHELARLSGAGFFGATVREHDFLIWDQYAWSAGVEVHDLSYSRLFAAGATSRPACFVVGDEDITSTGTDWVRTVGTGGAWADHGINATSTSPVGNPLHNTMAWMVVDNGCHEESLVPVHDPYSNQPNSWAGTNHAHALIESAIAQRLAEIAGGIAPQALVANPRGSSLAAQLRGLDDPQEWALGRLGGEMPANTTSDLLVRDESWSANAVQADSAGTMPGGKESIVVDGGFVYVGSTEGIVSKFRVDTTLPGQPFVRVARSPKLGVDAFALTATGSGSGWTLVVGTRRHLHKLDANLNVIGTSASLPWEVSQPRHLQVGDVIDSQGEEIVFNSVHGGLVFYRLDTLQPVHEWPEPGIVDFALTASGVTILSARGVVANVHFLPTTYDAVLDAVSQSVPIDYVNDPPCQGNPRDLELMKVNWGAPQAGLAVISTWGGDVDGDGGVKGSDAIRAHWQGTLARQPLLAGAHGVKDLATCKESTDFSGIGDHLLVLAGNELWLFNQFAQPKGCRSLVRTVSGAEYSFGTNSHALAVGDIVPNAGAYRQEVVIATTTGLVWMHIDDLVVGGLSWPVDPEVFVPPTLPAVYDPLFGSDYQPRTNRTTAATTAIAITGDYPHQSLDVLDVHGAHWRIGDDGSMALVSATLARGARNWSKVGVPMTSPLSLPHIFGVGPQGVGTLPWCPKSTHLAIFEKGPYAHVLDNWTKRISGTVFLDGFVVHPLGGAAVPVGLGPPQQPTTGHEIWSWTSPPAPELPLPAQPLGAWGNLVEGMQLTDAGELVGVWASTAEPTYSGSVIDKCDFHWLRTFSVGQMIMTQQAIKPVRLDVGGQDKTFLVLGCVGGRVRIVEPGAMRVDSQNPHDIGSRRGDSPDLGFGGCALDVEVAGPDLVKIWYGTINSHAPKPLAYGNPAGTLADIEVATGAVHLLHWQPSSQSVTVVASSILTPAGPTVRGGYGVVGLCAGDLLRGEPGLELVVGTMSGDLIVMRSADLSVLWATHVNGMVGHYNSILIEDYDGVGGPELYLGGSWGLWRFLVNLEPAQ